ncbi:MAG: GlsB/YeaQ/YmgE family stress response membrane protein [Saprospiraceae bacterium]
MGLIIWLVVGLIAGVLAKAITPQKESTSYITSMIIGLIGSMVGGFLANLTGLSSLFGRGLIGSIIIATLGAILVLWIYHKYLADKLNVKV